MTTAIPIRALSVIDVVVSMDFDVFLVVVVIGIGPSVFIFAFFWVKCVFFWLVWSCKLYTCVVDGWVVMVQSGWWVGGVLT